MNRDSFVDVKRGASWVVVCAFLLGCAACGHGAANGTNGSGSGSGTSDGSDLGSGDPDATPDAGVEAGSAVGSGSGSVVQDDPIPPPKLDLVDTVETTKSRADMSADLVKPAEKAFADRKWGKAIRLYSALVVARGPASAEALKLAEAWALAGQPDSAVEIYDRIIASSDDIATLRDVKKRRDAVAKVSKAFSSETQLPSLEKEATIYFKAGRAAKKKKAWGDALVNYQMGFALAPDLAGFLRELGDTYKELEAEDAGIDYYVQYLRKRPFGANADEIRKLLADKKQVLGTLTITANPKCATVLLINEQPMSDKLLGKALLVGPGSYDGFCLDEKYEFGMWAHADVVAGGEAKLKFEWALIVNKLVKPLGRIKMEMPEEPGTMMDLGVSSDTLGVQVPTDGRSLAYTCVDDTGEKTKSDHIKLEAGQRYEIKW